MKENITSCPTFLGQVLPFFSGCTIEENRAIWGYDTELQYWINFKDTEAESLDKRKGYWIMKSVEEIEYVKPHNPYLIWTGEDLKLRDSFGNYVDFYKGLNLEVAKKLDTQKFNFDPLFDGRVKSKSQSFKPEKLNQVVVKGEFEKTPAYHIRQANLETEKSSYVKERVELYSKFETELYREGDFNSWLGEQFVSMQYDADIEEFDVRTAYDFNFKFPVPIEEAREFKKNVKKFDFQFENRKGELILTEAKVKFNEQVYLVKLNIDGLVEKKKEVTSKAVKVENLIFQDFDLPKAMNWKDACEYCEKLRLLGFSDWRLTNKDELLLAYENRSRFKNVEKSYYWSITKYNSFH